MEVQNNVVSSSLSAPPQSSPQSVSSVDSSSHPSSPRYRAARTLPYELREHCMIYFEEGLYYQALNLLKSLLTSGATSPSQSPAIVPPPQLLALIATISVHPTLTTRAKSLDQIQAANLALQYLQLVLQHVGPINGNFEEAFAFTGNASVARREVTGRRRTTGGGGSPKTDVIDGINNELANTGSLWARSPDIWNMLGWCFNCSILHKKRWERWSAWTLYMIDVLEADFNARIAEAGSALLEHCLLAKYVNFSGSVPGTARDKKIVRALFADGCKSSVAEFGEIWPRETKGLKKDREMKKSEAKIDIEGNNYGDYMMDEIDEELAQSASEPSSPPSENLSGHGAAIPDTAEPLGGMDSIKLRVRLMALLINLSIHRPEIFTEPEVLYDIYSDHIRTLPIQTFLIILSPVNLQHFPAPAQSSFVQFILRALIGTSPLMPPSDDIPEETFANSYLPSSANNRSTGDNAKVSLCIETLLRWVSNHGELLWTPGLNDAAEVGIKARFVYSKKSKNSRLAGDKMWLAASAERIRSILLFMNP